MTSDINDRQTRQSLSNPHAALIHKFALDNLCWHTWQSQREKAAHGPCATGSRDYWWILGDQVCHKSKGLICYKNINEAKHSNLLEKYAFSHFGSFCLHISQFKNQHRTPNLGKSILKTKVRRDKTDGCSSLEMKGTFHHISTLIKAVSH